MGDIWRKVRPGEYRTTWKEEAWMLLATPKARRPWLLRTVATSRGKPVYQQEIGTSDVVKAKAQATMWLALSGLYIA